jgi:hypothetical protein
LLFHHHLAADTYHVFNVKFHAVRGIRTLN